MHGSNCMRNLMLRRSLTQVYRKRTDRDHWRCCAVASVKVDGAAVHDSLGR